MIKPRTATVLSILALSILAASFTKAQEQQEPEPETPPQPIRPTRTVSADLNGDGLIDLLLFPGTMDSAQLLRNKGDGTFEEVTADAGLLLPADLRKVFFEDLNGDARVDVIGVGAELILYQGMEEGRFQRVDHQLRIRDPFRFEDIDQDGLLDLLVFRKDGVTLIENQSVEDILFVRAFEKTYLPPEEEEAEKGEGGESSASSAAVGGNLSKEDRVQILPEPSEATSPGPSSGPGSRKNPVSPVISSCVASLTDMSGGACLQGSSSPQLGMLYPISSRWYVDANTGNVGIHTTTPNDVVLNVSNTTSTDIGMKVTNSDPTSSRNAFRADQYGTANALAAYNYGTGRAGLFTIDNANNNKNALEVTILNGTGYAVYAKSAGTAPSIYAEKLGSASGNTAKFYSEVGAHTLKAENVSDSARAGSFHISNNASTASTVYAKTSGSGYALEVVKGSVTTSGNAIHVSSGGGAGNNPDPTLKVVQSTGNAMAAWFSGNAYVSNKLGIGVSNPSEKLEVNGNAIISGTATTDVLTITGGSDLAEPFEVKEQDIEPGMVLCIDPDTPGKLRLSRKAYDTTVAGVLSGAEGINPGMIMSQKGVLDGTHPVALAGKVYVRVTGTVQPGDLLTTSDVPGHAMKVADFAKANGAVLGKAMTAHEQGTGIVLMVVALQ